MATDLLRWADEQLADARAALVAAVDRADAAVELRSTAYGLAADAGTGSLSLEQVDRLDEESRARFRALAQRVTNTTDTTDERTT